MDTDKSYMLFLERRINALEKRLEVYKKRLEAENKQNADMFLECVEKSKEIYKRRKDMAECEEALRKLIAESHGG